MVELHITVRFPVSQLSSLNPQLNKAASRLTVNLFGSVEPLPLYRRRRGDTEEDIAGSGLWFMVEGWEQWNRGKWKN